MPVTQAITAVVLGVGVALGMFVYFLVNQSSPTLHEPHQTHQRQYTRIVHPEPTPSASAKSVRRRKSKIAEDMQCMICLDEIRTDEAANSNAIILECDHIFHVKCIGIWEKEKSNCPVCRSDIK